MVAVHPSIWHEEGTDSDSGIPFEYRLGCDAIDDIDEATLENVAGEAKDVVMDRRRDLLSRDTVVTPDMKSSGWCQIELDETVAMYSGLSLRIDTTEGVDVKR